MPSKSATSSSGSKLYSTSYGARGEVPYDFSEAGLGCDACLSGADEQDGQAVRRRWARFVRAEVRLTRT